MGQLKLAGMRAAHDEILEEGSDDSSRCPRHRPLLLAQTSAAHARSIAYQLGMVKLPMAKTLPQFEFGASPVNEDLVRKRHGGDQRMR